MKLTEKFFAGWKTACQMMVVGLLAIGMAGCEKETADGNSDEPAPPVTPTPEPGNDACTFALILNEGSGNDAGLSRLDLATGSIDNNWFASANGRQMGNNGQDLVAYGTKVYVTVTESNSLEVVNPATGLSQRVDMGSRKPRSIAADNGKLYITCYDKTVVRMDTATLTIDGACPLGDFRPEGIAIAQGKAFVASTWNNEGGYNYDNTLYIIDLATFSNPETIHFGMNTENVQRMDDNHVIVTWRGNYGDIAAGSAIVDATTLEVIPTAEPLSKMDIYGGKAYGYSLEYDEYYNETSTFRIVKADGTAEAFPFTPSLDANAYGINVNPDNGDIFIMSADYQTNGDIYCFSADGTLKYKKETAVNPSKMVFLK